MTKMPGTRALFGYDVIGSSANDDDQLDDVRVHAAQYVAAAFRQTGVETEGLANYSPTGDGALAAYPESSLAELVDAAHHLNTTLVEHNRYHLPPVRLRISIHASPVRVGEHATFQRGTIELARVLDAPPLKAMIERLGDYRIPAVALIVTDRVFRTAVRGGYTELIRPWHFSPLPIKNKEFDELCWVHVPDTDLRDVVPTPDKEQSAQDRTSDPSDAGTTISQQFHGAVGPVFGRDNTGSITIDNSGRGR